MVPKISEAVSLAIEIWGDKPLGNDEEKYAKRRADKERFNKDNPRFLGIHFSDCFDEGRLSEILKPHIGEIAAFRFDLPTDKIIRSTHWSNTDQLLDYCREFASSMPEGKFPTEEWLRKRGKWSEREGEAYNTLAVYIKTWFGGIRKLRELLGQGDVSTISWGKESAIEAYKTFYKEHGLTPGQVRHEGRKKNGELSEELLKKAACIDHAIRKYAGGTRVVNELLGIIIERPRKWSKEKIIEGYKDVIDHWGLSPNQLINDHRKRKITLPEEEYRKLGQLIDVAGREFGGSRKVMEIFSFTPPSRKRKKRGS